MDFVTFGCFPLFPVFVLNEGKLNCPLVPLYVADMSKTKDTFLKVSTIML